MTHLIFVLLHLKLIGVRNMKTFIKTYDLTKEWPPTDTIRWCYRNSLNTNRRADGCLKGGGLIVRQLKDMLRDDEGYLIVAHNGEKLVGWAVAYICYKPAAWQFQCYVPPRQRRKGIGSKLLKKACSLVGRVEVFNTHSSNWFYKANGLTHKEAITGKRLKVK